MNTPSLDLAVEVYGLLVAVMLAQAVDFDSEIEAWGVHGVILMTSTGSPSFKRTSDSRCTWIRRSMRPSASRPCTGCPTTLRCSATLRRYYAPVDSSSQRAAATETS